MLMRLTTLTVRLGMLLAALALSAGAASAQDAPTDELAPSGFTGLQHSIVRAYSLDYSALLEGATPGAEPGIPTGIFLIGATILEFDSSDNAAAALAKLDEDTSPEDVAQGEDAEVTELDLGVGDAGVAYSGVEDLNGRQTEMVVAIIQQDVYVYFVTVGGSDVDVQARTIEFVTGLIDREGSGAGEFSEDGTSTGGLWDKYPAADDPVVSGLIPYDQVLYPDPASTPET